jgi:hypothetical protein
MDAIDKHIDKAAYFYYGIVDINSPRLRDYIFGYRGHR